MSSSPTNPATLWSDVFDSACQVAKDVLGMGEEALADSVGVGRKSIRAWRAPDVKATPRLADIAKLPVTARRVIVDALAAGLGCALVDLPEPAYLAGHVRACGAVAKECGEVVSTFGEAIADGYLQADEASKTRAEIREAVAALLAVDEQLAAVERERVVGVRV